MAAGSRSVNGAELLCNSTCSKCSMLRLKGCNGTLYGSNSCRRASNGIRGHTNVPHIAYKHNLYQQNTGDNTLKRRLFANVRKHTNSVMLPTCCHLAQACRVHRVHVYWHHIMSSLRRLQPCSTSVYHTKHGCVAERLNSLEPCKRLR